MATRTCNKYTERLTVLLACSQNHKLMAQAIADGIFFAEVTRSHSGAYSLGHFDHASYDMYLPNLFASAEEVQEDIDDKADQDELFNFNRDDSIEGATHFS